MTTRHPTAWTFAITSAALFMASLDNLVVTTALPSIREHLHASLEGLQWTVNAYTLTFAVLLLTGATLGERYGRRRLFTIGLALFTAGSAAAALAPGIGALVTARAVQGVGAAIVIPLTLTLLSAAVSPQRRGLALGAWGAVGGLAIAIGPLVGGAVVEGASWQWIFWLNVPIGVALLPIARLRLTESRGSSTSLDLPGLVLASVGLLGIVLGVVRGNDHGWTSVTVLPPLVIGALLVAAFIGWELRARQPMLPLYLFRSRGFAVTNLASLLMFFGMFGSIFLLAQFLQVVQHYSPLQAGLRTLPWTAMPVFIAPVAGALSDRIGGGRWGWGGGRRWPAPPCPTSPWSRRSSSPASACPCSSRPSPTSCSARYGGTRKASPPVPTTRSGNWAASSGSPYSARCSPPTAVTPAGPRSSPAWPPRSGSARRQWPSPRPPRCSCPGCAGRKRAASLPSRSRNSLRSANQPGTKPGSRQPRDPGSACHLPSGGRVTISERYL
jgi:MFS family permease